MTINAADINIIENDLTFLLFLVYIDDDKFLESLHNPQDVYP